MLATGVASTWVRRESHKRFYLGLEVEAWLELEEEDGQGSVEEACCCGCSSIAARAPATASVALHGCAPVLHLGRRRGRSEAKHCIGGGRARERES